MFEVLPISCLHNAWLWPRWTCKTPLLRAVRTAKSDTMLMPEDVEICWIFPFGTPPQCRRRNHTYAHAGVLQFRLYVSQSTLWSGTFVFVMNWSLNGLEIAFSCRSCAESFRIPKVLSRDQGASPSCRMFGPWMPATSKENQKHHLRDVPSQFRYFDPLGFTPESFQTMQLTLQFQPGLVDNSKPLD